MRPARSSRAWVIALATIAVIAMASASRLAVAQSPPPTAASASTASPPTPARPATMRPVDANAPQLPARIDEGSKIALPPMVIAQDRPGADRRPMYIGAGLIVLALVFWWNRRQRDRFEREDHGTPPVRPPRDGDDDADELHAAARGDRPDAEAEAERPQTPERQHPR